MAASEGREKKMFFDYGSARIIQDTDVPELQVELYMEFYGPPKSMPPLPLSSAQTLD